ncbi:MAG: DUF3307 domain-containing protein [Clostridia bacterium]
MRGINMCFDYLFLGHLLGDFTFQTNRIAENKASHYKWNLYHSVIVTFCMLISALPFGYLIMGLVVLNGVSHFIIDYYKSKLPDRSPLCALVYFVLDQSAHLIIIFLISSFYRGGTYSLPFNKGLTDLFTMLVLVSSYAAIIIQYMRRLIFVSHGESFFIGNEKIVGILSRILIFLVFYFSKFTSDAIILIIIPILVARIFYYNRKWHSLMVPAYFYIGLLMDFLIPASVLYFF